MRRPLIQEYTSYHAQYIENVPGGDPLHALERQVEEALQLLASLPEERGGFRYAPGKWSLKEVFGHVIDTERIFTTRCLAFARGEEQALPGFDQDAYVARAGFDRRSLASLGEELRAVRSASLTLFRSLGEEEWSRTGVACGNRLTVRVFPWLAAGHERHHLQVLRQRYL